MMPRSPRFIRVAAVVGLAVAVAGGPILDAATTPLAPFSVPSTGGGVVFDVRAIEGPCSDIGVPLRPVRPDDPANWRGIVRAGGPKNPGEFGCWDTREIGRSTNEHNIGYARKLIFHFWRMAQKHEPVRPIPHPDTSWAEAARYAWLFEIGAAGWHTVESNVEWGKDARHHWDVWRGARSGWTVGPEGWTHHTACGGQQEQDSILARFRSISPAERMLTATWSLAALGFTTHTNDHVDTTVIYVSTSGSNSNDGLTPGAPKLTTQGTSGAASATTLTHPDWILHKRGDAFSGEDNRFSQGNTGGPSDANPYRIGSYGTGARPTFDVGVNTWVGGLNYGSIHIEDGDCWSSTFNPDSADTPCAVNIINFDGTYSGLRIENCRSTKLYQGYILQHSGTGGTTGTTLRRCHANRGLGAVFAALTSDPVCEECVFDHCGWMETTEVTLRSNTAVAADATTVTLDAGASIHGSFYVGSEITMDSQTRVITAYNETTKVATLATSWTAAAGAFVIKGLGRNTLRHNMYYHGSSNAGYVCRRSFVARGSQQGIGRMQGHIYHNWSEDNGTEGIYTRRDVAGGTNLVEQNHVVGRYTQDGGELGFVVSRCITSGPNNIDGEDITFDDNTGGAGRLDFSFATCGGFTVSPANSGTLTISNNRFADFFTDHANHFETCLGLLPDGRTGATLVVTDNKFYLQSTGKWLMYAENITPSSPFDAETWTGNQWYRGGGSSTAAFYYNTVQYNFADFVTQAGETGTFTDPGFTTAPKLPEWCDAALETTGSTMQDAIDTAAGFDRGTGEWKRRLHLADWAVSWARVQMGAAAFVLADLPYPITISGFDAVRNGLDVDASWDAFAEPNLSDSESISVEADTVEVETAAPAATGVTVTGGANGTYRARAVDWLGVGHQYSDEIEVSDALPEGDGTHYGVRVGSLFLRTEAP